MATTPASRRTRRLLLTCEHAGNRIPPEHRDRFRGAGRTLRSHRGWDPGALDLANELGRRLRQPVRAVTWSRLLVEANRSPTNPRLWSSYTSDLPPEAKQAILERYWWPHRQGVADAVDAAIAAGERVVHVAVHSFTPVYDGAVRNADVGLLYDPARPAERELAERWAELLRARAPDLRVRRNYPYRGAADGLARWLRKRSSQDDYVGLELEVNQGLLSGRRRQDVAAPVADSLATLVGVGARHPRGGTP